MVTHLDLQFGMTWEPKEVSIRDLKLRVFSNSLRNEGRNCRPLLLGARPTSSVDDSDVMLMTDEDLSGLLGEGGNWYNELKDSFQKEGVWKSFEQSVFVSNTGRALAGQARLFVINRLLSTDPAWSQQHGKGGVFKVWVATKPMSQTQAEAVSLLLQQSSPEVKGLRIMSSVDATVTALRALYEYHEVRSFCTLQSHKPESFHLFRNIAKN